MFLVRFLQREQVFKIVFFFFKCSAITWIALPCNSVLFAARIGNSKQSAKTSHVPLWHNEFREEEERGEEVEGSFKPQKDCVVIVGAHLILRMK